MTPEQIRDRNLFPPGFLALQTFAKELVALQPDFILTSSTPSGTI
jgi:hypothetical protein